MMKEDDDPLILRRGREVLAQPFNLLLAYRLGILDRENFLLLLGVRESFEIAAVQ